MGYGVLNYHFFGCGFIEMLMVGEQYRRHGIGLALLNGLKSKCLHPKFSPPPIVLIYLCNACYALLDL